MKDISAYYEIRFKAISYDKINDFEIKSFTKKIENKNLLVARNEAFELFDDYVQFIKERIDNDDRGNLKIIKSPFVISKREELKNDFTPDPLKENPSLLELVKQRTSYFLEYEMEMRKYREDISVFLVIESEKLLKELIYWKDENSNYEEFLIHQVSSGDIQEQEMVDNLESIELELYKLLEIDVTQLTNIVYHYGADFEESGEDVEEGAKREILQTPYIWRPLSEYNWLYHYSADANPTQIDFNNDDSNNKLNYAEIISQGESNSVEFKPALVYNFKTKRGGIGVKYIIAKTINSFLNSNGGILFVGVKDDGSVSGLDNDYSLFENENHKDKMLLELDDTITQLLSKSLKPLINASIIKIENKDVLVVEVEQSPKPVFVNYRGEGSLEKKFYARLNASTHEYRDVEEIIDYVFNKEWRKG